MNSLNTISLGQSMIFSVNPEGSIIYSDSFANQFFNITNLTPGDYKISTWMTQDDYASFVEICKNLSPVQPFTFLETKVIRTGKAEAWMDWYVAGRFDADENLYLITINAKDITHFIQFRRTEEKIELLLQAVNSMIFEFSITENKVLFISENIQQVVGIPAEAFYENPSLPFELIHPDDLTKIFESLERIPHSMDESVEYRGKMGDGTYKWFQIQARLLLDTNGIPTSVFGIITEISGQRLSKILLESLLKSSLGPIIVAKNQSTGLDGDLDFSIGLINYKATELFKINAGHVLNQPLHTHIPQLREQGLEKQMHLALESSSPIYLKKSKFKVQDEFRYFNISIDPIDDSVVVIFQDITEEVNNEHLMQILRRDYEMVFQGSNDAIFLVEVTDDDKFIFLRSNHMHQKLTGIPQEEFAQKSPVQLLGDIIGTQVEENLSSCLRSVESISYEEILETKNGRQIWYTTLNPVMENGKVTHIAGVSREVTDARMAEMELEASEIKFRSLFNAMQDLIFVLDDKGIYIEYYQPENVSNPFMKPEEFLNKHFSEVLPHSVSALMEAAIQKVQSGEIHISFEFSLSLGDKVFWFLAGLSNIQVSKNLKTRYLVVVRNINELKSKEQELIASEHRVKDLFDNAHDLIQSVSPDGEFLYVNSSWLKTLGYDQAELAELNIMDVIHPDSALVWEKYLISIVAGELIDGLELDLITKSGDRIVVEGNGSCRFDNGNLAAIRFIFRNITEKKAAELKEAETRAEIRKLAMVSQLTSNAVIIVNTEGKIEWVNEGYTKMSGFEPDEVVGMPVFSKTGGKETDRTIVERISSGLSSGQSFNELVIKYKKDGRKYIVQMECRPMLDDHDKVQGFMVIERDITERKMAEEALEYRSDFQKVVVTLATNFINTSIKELNNAITLALAQIGNFLKVDRAYLFEYDWNKNVMNNTNEWHKEGLFSRMHRMQDVSTELIRDWVLAHVNGKAISIQLGEEDSGKFGINALLNKEGVQSLIALPLIHERECLGFVGFDVSSGTRTWTDDEMALLRILAELFTNAWIRKRFEKEIIDAKEVAEAAAGAKGRFLANMSHEIRTPMNGIIGFIDLLSRTQLLPDQMDYLNEAQNASQMLLHLLNDILDFSKIEADKLTLEHNDFNLRKAIEDSVTLVAPKAFEKKLELNAFIAKEVPEMVLGDMSRLRQILNNLLNNAVKFTEKGEIYVEVKLIHHFENSVDLQIDVQDTGIGMSEESLTELFQPFKQADDSTTRKYGGTGLGLSISKKLSEMMGGDLLVQSNYGVGSTFSLRIPMEISSLKASSGVSDINILKGQKILLVDDLPANRRIVSNYLSEAGCEVSVADSGVAAIELLLGMHPNEKPFHIAVLDHQMPGMDGVQLARTLKTIAATREIRLVMLTSLAYRDDSKSMKEIGFELFLTKPIKRDELLQRLSQMLSYSPDDNRKIQDKLKPASISGISFGGIKMLIVEDNEANSKLLYTFLTNYGADCKVAFNGLEGINMTLEEKFDLILMDCQMPVMDGYEASRNLRASDSINKNIPIIALTAYAMAGDREKCLAAGMTDYISKPLDLNMLLEKVNQHTKMSSHMETPDQSNPTALNAQNASSSLTQRSVIDHFVSSTGMKETQVKEIFDLFFESLPGLLSEIEEALQQDDFYKLERAIHKLKGTSGNLMIQDMYKLIVKMEQLSKAYDLESVRNHMGQLMSMARSLLPSTS